MLLPTLIILVIILIIMITIVIITTGKGKIGKLSENKDRNLPNEIPQLN